MFISQKLVELIERDADKLSFAEIEKYIKELVIKSQSGKLSIDDLRGGTFTITNGGVFGSLNSTPIICRALRLRWPWPSKMRSSINRFGATRRNWKCASSNAPPSSRRRWRRLPGRRRTCPARSSAPCPAESPPQEPDRRRRQPPVRRSLPPLQPPPRCRACVSLPYEPFP